MSKHRDEVTFRVSLRAPRGASDAQIKNYIKDWIQSGCGSLHQDDPMFHLDRKSVYVTKIKEG